MQKKKDENENVLVNQYSKQTTIHFVCAAQCATKSAVGKISDSRRIRKKKTRTKVKITAYAKDETISIPCKREEKKNERRKEDLHT